MIKSNLVSPRSEKGIKGMKARPSSKSSGGKRGSKGNFFFMLFISLIAAVVYLEFFGVPSFLRGVIPQSVIEFLGLSEETAAKQVLREAGTPQLTAHGSRLDDPTIPLNGSVEEVVKTMRPDIYFKGKVLTDYKELALSNRIPYQKQAFHIMLATFYKATPDGIGYLDLAYQAPNFYFIRAIAMDARTRNSYMEQLRSKDVDFVVRDSATIKDGSIEFSMYGGFRQPEVKELSSANLVSPSKIKGEVLKLRSLATANQVRLTGLENPIEEEFGTYRRVTIKTTSEADYPSLLNFAEALQKSDIPFGVQQFISRPAGPEKMQSALEFVMYAAIK